MSSILDFTSNFSFYTIPAAWALALAPRAYATSLYESKSSKKFDTKSPRTFIAKCEADQSLDITSKAGFLTRCSSHWVQISNALFQLSEKSFALRRHILMDSRTSACLQQRSPLRTLLAWTANCSITCLPDIWQAESCTTMFTSTMTPLNWRWQELGEFRVLPQYRTMRPLKSRRVFMTGIGIIMSLFVMSGNKMRNAAIPNLA